jgi:hypothetical protein
MRVVGRIACRYQVGDGGVAGGCLQAEEHARVHRQRRLPALRPRGTRGRSLVRVVLD